MGLTDEELHIIMEEDQSREHQQLPLPTESWNAPLPILYDDVQCRVKSAAEWMKRNKATGIDHESNVERYLQLTNVQLGLRLWGDDIVVQGESALGTIENDSTGFEILAPRLRTCFQDMLAILVDGELFTETNNDFSEFDELEQLVQHLRNFAGPLRTYQESAKNVGDVAAIRAAAAACLQQQSHLPTTVSGILEDKGPGTPDKGPGTPDKGPGTPDKVSSHDQKPTPRPSDQEAARQAVESTPEDHLSRAWRLHNLGNMLPCQDESCLDDLCGLCIQGYRSFQSLKGLGMEAQVILSKMEIQEHRLQALKQTLETIRKAVDTKGLGLVTQLVYNTLESIKRITTDTDHLRAQYKLKFEISSSSSLEDDEEPEPGHALVKIRKPHVIEWLHFDNDNMEKLAADLKMLTDFLERLVALAAVPYKMPPTLISAATALLATSDPRALANLAAASAQEYPELAADARRKLELLVPESYFAVGSARRKSRLSVDDFDVANFSGAAAGADNDGQPQVAMVAATSEVVLLDWRWLPPDNRRWILAVEHLATASALLQVPRSATLRTLDCAGFTLNPAKNRAALVYRFPPGAARGPPTTLLRLLQDADAGGKTAAGLAPPTLNDRCALALALAETVFRLHMSGWLHLSVNAHNVLFFAAAGSEGVRTILQGGLKTPLLTGFGFAWEDQEVPMRDAGMDALSVGRYRHPDSRDAFEAGFNKTHDLYSLGMVLLEIGFWKPFDRPTRYTPTRSPSENRDRIVRKYLGGHLAHYMGNAFETVVRTCLTGDFGCDVSEDAAFQRRVYGVVVEPLKRLMSGL